MENRLIDKDIVGITALMVHAARIDENYSSDEKNYIKFYKFTYQKR